MSTHILCKMNLTIICNYFYALFVVASKAKGEVLAGQAAASLQYTHTHLAGWQVAGLNTNPPPPFLYPSRCRAYPTLLSLAHPTPPFLTQPPSTLLQTPRPPLPLLPTHRKPGSFPNIRVRSLPFTCKCRQIMSFKTHNNK